MITKLCSKCHEVKPCSKFQTVKESKRAVSYLKAECKACGLKREQARLDVRFELVATYLENHPCTDCNEDDMRVLEFDHVRGEKVANISNLWRGQHSMATWVLLEEMAKCDVVCANCHRVRTYNRYADNNGTSRRALRYASHGHEG